MPVLRVPLRDTGFPATAVTLEPKQLANANLRYRDVDSGGTAAARRVCGVTSGRVQVILPDETRAKQVEASGGVDNGTLTICGRLSVQPFAGVPGAKAGACLPPGAVPVVVGPGRHVRGRLPGAPWWAGATTAPRRRGRPPDAGAGAAQSPE